MMNKQKGFTIVELLVCVGGLLALSVAIGIGYVAIHFIGKFW